MSRFISVLFVFLFSSCAVQADSQLDRLEAAQEMIADKTKALMQAEAPNVAKLFPDMSWDAQTKTAMQCFLNEIESRNGADAVKQYVNDYENFAKRDFTTFRQTTEVPMGVETEDLFKVNEACGIMKIAKERMSKSGYDKVFSDPALMQELSALFNQE